MENKALMSATMSQTHVCGISQVKKKKGVDHLSENKRATVDAGKLL